MFSINGFNVRGAWRGAGPLWILATILFQTLGGVCVKYASTYSGLASLVAGGFYLLSLGCLALQAVVWQQALRRYEVSFAYPFLSLVNFTILACSFALFGEGVTVANLAGLALITLGICLMSRGAGEK